MASTVMHDLDLYRCILSFIPGRRAIDWTDGDLAIKCGHLELLHNFYHQMIFLDPNTLNIGVSTNNIEIVQFILNNNINMDNILDTCKHERCDNYLYHDSHYNITCKSYIFLSSLCTAIEYGYLEIATLLYRVIKYKKLEQCRYYKSNMFDIALRSGNLETINWYNDIREKYLRELQFRLVLGQVKSKKRIQLKSITRGYYDETCGYILSIYTQYYRLYLYGSEDIILPDFYNNFTHILNQGSNIDSIKSVHDINHNHSKSFVYCNEDLREKISRNEYRAYSSLCCYICTSKKLCNKCSKKYTNISKYTHNKLKILYNLSINKYLTSLKNFGRASSDMWTLILSQGFTTSTEYLYCIKSLPAIGTIRYIIRSGKLDVLKWLDKHCSPTMQKFYNKYVNKYYIKNIRHQEVVKWLKKIR